MKPTFSPSEAAFSVFELAKRDPQFVLRYCILNALIVIGLYTLLAGSGLGETANKFLAMSEGRRNPTPDEIAKLFANSTGAFGIIAVYGIVTNLL
ncbi:MAG: hypothetical protein RL186_649, partial [Pseudomonadota bacterium]